MSSNAAACHVQETASLQSEMVPEPCGSGCDVDVPLATERKHLLSATLVSCEFLY